MKQCSSATTHEAYRITGSWKCVLTLGGEFVSWAWNMSGMTIELLQPRGKCFESQYVLRSSTRLHESTAHFHVLSLETYVLKNRSHVHLKNPDTKQSQCRQDRRNPHRSRSSPTRRLLWVLWARTGAKEIAAPISGLSASGLAGPLSSGRDISYPSVA